MVLAVKISIAMRTSNAEKIIFAMDAERWVCLAVMVNAIEKDYAVMIISAIFVKIQKILCWVNMMQASIVQEPGEEANSKQHHRKICAGRDSNPDIRLGRPQS